MRHRILALLLVGAVGTGCDAGNRDEANRARPGNDNLWSGPELAVQIPAAGTVVETDRPRFMFELRGSEGDVILYMVDDEWARAWKDATVPLPPHPELARGTHVLRAFVVGADGTPYANEQATAVAPFHVFEESRAFGGVDEKGHWRAFDRNAPCLMVASETGDKGQRRFVVAASGCRLDGSSYRVWFRHNQEEPRHLGAGVVELYALPEGTHELVFELQRAAGEGDAKRWEPVPGPLNRKVLKLEL